MRLSAVATCVVAHGVARHCARRVRTVIAAVSAVRTTYAVDLPRRTRNSAPLYIVLTLAKEKLGGVQKQFVSQTVPLPAVQLAGAVEYM